MELLGIGLPELFFIVLIALIILGPRDMVKAGRTIGRFLRRTIFSPSWMNIQSKMRTLPYTLMREAGLEDLDLNQGIKDFQREVNQTIGPELKNDASLNKLAQDVRETTQIPNEWLSPPPAASASAPPASAAASAPVSAPASAADSEADSAADSAPASAAAPAPASAPAPTPTAPASPPPAPEGEGGGDLDVKG